MLTLAVYKVDQAAPGRQEKTQHRRRRARGAAHAAQGNDFRAETTQEVDAGAWEQEGVGADSPD